MHWTTHEVTKRGRHADPHTNCLITKFTSQDHRKYRLLHHEPLCQVFVFEAAICLVTFYFYFSSLLSSVLRRLVLAVVLHLLPTCLNHCLLYLLSQSLFVLCSTCCVFHSISQFSNYSFWLLGVGFCFEPSIAHSLKRLTLVTFISCLQHLGQQNYNQFPGRKWQSCVLGIEFYFSCLVDINLFRSVFLAVPVSSAFILVTSHLHLCSSPVLLHVS